MLELCTAGTLADAAVSRLGLTLFADATRQLADALAYLHARGYVHGDVKMENVLIRKRTARNTADDDVSNPSNAGNTSNADGDLSNADDDVGSTDPDRCRDLLVLCDFGAVARIRADTGACDRVRSGALRSGQVLAVAAGCPSTLRGRGRRGWGLDVGSGALGGRQVTHLHPLPPHRRNRIISFQLYPTRNVFFYIYIGAGARLFLFFWR